ncbi:MAG TPA: VTT domain-containing protein [Halanaerobiales bacterium]|nr:VTT domain-containing protein [Halanaerobiales bacterium]
MKNTPYHIKVKMIVLILFFIGISILAFFLRGDIYAVIKDPVLLKNWMSVFGSFQIIMFILIQAVQVIVFIVPGELVEIAAGFLFGTTLGSIYSIIGIAFGSAASFIIARVLGYDFVKWVVPEQMFNRWNIFINEDKRGGTVLFLLYFIPGTPKDALAYFAGITPVSYLKFIFISMFARLPAIVFSAYIGANIEQKEYTNALIVSVIAGIAFLIGFIYRDRIIKWLYQL